MSVYSHDLEKCDVCFTLVNIEKQTQGVCHACIEQHSLTTCSQCGDLFKCNQLNEEFECPLCIDKRTTAQVLKAGKTDEKLPQPWDRLKEIEAYWQKHDKGSREEPNPENDEFRCVKCERILDIEDSVKIDMDLYCTGCKPAEEDEKSFGEILDELLEQSNDNEYVLNQLVNGYGYQHRVADFLISRLRVMKEVEQPSQNVEALHRALRRLTDGETNARDCEFNRGLDHCMAHGHDVPCPVAEAKELIANRPRKKGIIPLDLITYLEMARVALDRDDVRDQILDSLDLSEAEAVRLSKQLEEYLS